MPDAHPSTAVKLTLAASLALHLLFVVSLHTGFLNPFFVEANEGFGQASDYFGIYRAGVCLRDGYSIYDSEIYRDEAPQTVPYHYFYRYLPPTAYAAALASIILEPWTAYWGWVVMNEMLIALVVIALLRSVRWSVTRRWIAASLWLGYFPLYIEQFMGQFSLTMAVLLFILWRTDLEEGGRERGDAGTSGGGAVPDPGPVRAVLAWSASLVLKSFTVLFVVSYLRDRRIRRTALGLTVAALSSLPYFAVRPADLAEFLRLNLRPFTPELYKGDFGFQAFLRNILSVLPTGWTERSISVAGRMLNLPRVVMAAAALLVILAALRATVRAAAEQRRRTLDYVLWTSVFFLVYKSVWEYHYVMMLPVVTAAYLVTGSRLVIVAGVLMGLPTVYVALAPLTGVEPLAALATWPAWFRFVHFGVKSVPAAALFGWCLWTAQKR